MAPFSFAFAQYTGGTVPEDVLQYGNLVIATGRTPSGNFNWWEGPDFQLGYVVARPKSNNQPTPITGVFAGVGFWRSLQLTDASFVELGNAVIPSGTYDRAAAVATYFRDEEIYYITWDTPLAKILYSGDSYDYLWLSGQTSLPTQVVSVTYQKNATNLYLGINLNGSGSGFGQWELINRFLQSVDYPYQTLRVNLDNQGLTITVNVTDGTNYAYGYDSGSGVQNIDVNISSLTGFITCWVFCEKSGINTNGYVEIYGVETIQLANIPTPYPYPAWGNLNCDDVTYEFTSFQLNGFNENPIYLDLDYNPSFGYMAYKITNTQESYNPNTAPLSQGFSYADPNTPIAIQPGDWLSFSAYNTTEAQLITVQIINNNDSFAVLDTFTINFS